MLGRAGSYPTAMGKTVVVLSQHAGTFRHRDARATQESAGGMQGATGTQGRCCAREELRYGLRISRGRKLGDTLQGGASPRKRCRVRARSTGASLSMTI